jgi:hypothetical protein
MRQRLARDFGSMFPVSGINRLGECSHFNESLGLPNLGDIVLDSSQESFVELMAGSCRTPFQLRSKLVELNDILGYTLGIAHMKGLDVSFSITNGIVGSEVSA